MSLLLDIDKINNVLINGRWYHVKNKSFTMDAYEFIERHKGSSEFQLYHAGGESGVCATGFCFRTSMLKDDADEPSDREEVYIAGPLTAIEAVTY